MTDETVDPATFPTAWETLTKLSNTAKHCLLLLVGGK